MKFQIDRDEFANSLKIVASVATTSPVSPVLALAKLTLQENGIELVSTDLLTVALARASCAVVAADAVPVLVDPALLLKYVKTLPDGLVMVETDKDTLVVRSGKTRSALAVASAAQYPALPSLAAVQGDMWKQVPSGKFFADLDAVRHVISTSADTPQFCQAAVQDDAWLAYDGVRLHRKPCEGYTLPSFTVPYYGVKPLRSLLAKQDYDTFEMALVDLATVYRTPGLTLLIYNLKAKFADTSNILKQAVMSQPLAVDVDRDEMLSALARVAHTTDSTGALRMDLGPDVIALSTGSSIGNTRTEVSCSGSVEQVAYVQTTHLFEAFKALPSASGVLYFGDHANVSGAKEVSPVRLVTPPGVEKFEAVFSQLKKDVL